VLCISSVYPTVISNSFNKAASSACGVRGANLLCTRFALAACTGTVARNWHPTVISDSFGKAANKAANKAFEACIVWSLLQPASMITIHARTVVQASVHVLACLLGYPTGSLLLL
jgi:hypothetical protein